MRWITSWCKKELTKQNFRLAGWLSVGYFIVLFLSIVIGQIDRLSHINKNPGNYYYTDNLMIHGGFIPAVLLFIMPTLTALVLFRYLHKQDASDFIHSLPSTRKTIYLHHITFGVFSILLPQILTYISLLIVNQTMDHQQVLHLVDINSWFHLSASTALIVFGVSVFVAMLTGVTLVQLIFTYIFLFLPVGLTLLVVFNLHYALPGLSLNYLVDGVIIHFSPLTDLSHVFMDTDLNWIKVIIYYVLTVVMLILSYILYKRRPVESANQAIAFHSLKPIFIYSFTGSFMMIGGMYAGAFEYELPMLFLMYLIFSIIGYYISQMIVEKSWRVFKKVKQYGFFLVGAILLMIGFSLDITGFVHHVPDLDEIEEAYVIDDDFSFNERVNYYGRQPGFTDPDDIKTIQALHKDLIDSAERNDFLNYDRSIKIMYILEDGSEVVREYSLDEEEFELFENYHINNHPLYRRYSEPLFYIDPAKVNKVEVKSDHYSYKELTITDRDQIVELIDRLRKDALRLPQEENRTYMMNSLSIHIPGEQEVYINLTYEHEATLQWFEEQNLTKEALILAEDIEKIVITPFREDLYYDAASYETTFSDNERTVYTSTDQINALLHQINTFDGEPEYMVMIYLKQLSEPMMRTTGQSFVFPK
jgi:ABC-2 type transport system permease protein